MAEIEHDPNDELSVEELDEAAGGSIPPSNGTCPNTNCPCASDPA